MGLVGFGPTTSPLSGVRSNQLSYRPTLKPQKREDGSSPLIIKERFVNRAVIQITTIEISIGSFATASGHRVEFIIGASQAIVKGSAALFYTKIYFTRING